MAVIKPSALISDIKGRINGSVFQKGTAGITMRTQTGVINRNTPNQRLIKNEIAVLAGAWQDLTDRNRENWEAYSVYRKQPTKKFSDRFMNGHALFVHTNLYRRIYSTTNALIGETILETPFYTDRPEQIEALSMTNHSHTSFVTTNRVLAAATELIIAYVSFPGSSSANWIRRKTRMINFTSVNGSEQDLAEDIYVKYGQLPQAGRYVNIKLMIMDKATGVLSYLTEKKVIVIQGV